MSGPAPTFSARNRAICAGYVAGSDIRKLAAAYGVTFQRIQQIVARGVVEGVVPSWLATMRRNDASTINRPDVRERALAVRRQHAEDRWSPELQVMLEALAGRGFTGADIAAELGVTPYAVATHARKAGLQLQGNPEVTAVRLKCSLKAAWADPDSRARRLAKANSPETRAKMSAARKAWWARRRAEVAA